MKLARIFRWVLTMALVVCVYFETGIVTSVSMFLLFVAVELKHLPLKSDDDGF